MLDLIVAVRVFRLTSWFGCTLVLANGKRHDPEEAEQAGEKTREDEFLCHRAPPRLGTDNSGMSLYAMIEQSLCLHAILIAVVLTAKRRLQTAQEIACLHAFQNKGGLRGGKRVMIASPK